ncbi:MAG TPA: TIR domain-containing protein [Pyrinomonadaceae bacterium]|jgi:V8-like Glu-specific endopeptidase
MPAQLNTAIARIFTSTGEVAGAGFLISGTHVITSAHVIAQALNLSDETSAQPSDHVRLDFPLTTSHTKFDARVVCWRPVRADTTASSSTKEDIAVLELELKGQEIEAKPIHLTNAGNVWGHSFRAFGFPPPYDAGAWVSGKLLDRVAGNRIQIEVHTQSGHFVTEGFSGTAVWDEQLEGVVGMVAGSPRRADNNAASVIPTETLLGVWPDLRPQAGPRPIELFFSYSHRDEKLRDELEKHLAMLKRQGLIEGWHDRKILASSEWAGEIDAYLDRADIILLLISADFLNSNYCYGVEMKRAIERHQAGEARVVPILLRECDWKSSPFAKLHALPTDAKPITNWPNRAQAFTNVAKGLRSLVESLRR